MRNALPTILTLLTIALTASSQLVSNLDNPSLEDPTQGSNTYDPAFPHVILQKRQYNPTICASGYVNCASLGAPGLCCRPNTRCAVDNAGYVACCPIGAVCTGVITALTGTTTTTTPQIISPTSNNGLILASTGVTTTVGLGATSTQGFIIAGGTTVVTGVSGGRPARGMVRWYSV